jgi:uncharacterized FlaG/YvyC family protein
MNHVGGMGGFSAFSRLRRVTWGKRGEKALSLLRPDDVDSMSRVHEDSENLRRFAERFAKRKRPDRESTARFELDKETGKIFVELFDSETGKLEMKLSPEEVAECLKSLEEAIDNEEPLSSFFVDLKI